MTDSVRELVPSSHLHRYNPAGFGGPEQEATKGQIGHHQNRPNGPAGRSEGNYTIVEGTSAIKRLVIARAISGVHHWLIRGPLRQPWLIPTAAPALAGVAGDAAVDHEPVAAHLA